MLAQKGVLTYEHMKKKSFEKDVPLALSVVVLWTLGVVFIPYMQQAMFPDAALALVQVAYLALHVVVFVIALLSIRTLLSAAGLSARLLRRDPLLHLALYGYTIAGVFVSLFFIMH